MRLITKCVIWAWICVIALSGCNNDVFLDNHDMPEYESVAIDGDGGEMVFTASLDDLEYFGFDIMSFEEHCYKHYNFAGEEIDRGSAPQEVSRIVYETDFSKMELVRNGSTFTVRSICNASRWNSYKTLRFEYSYGVRFKEIEILPGRPLEIVDVAYPDGVRVMERARVSTCGVMFHNGSSLSQSVELRPYLNELASVLVVSDDPSSWINGERFRMPVPVYVGDGWRMVETDGIVPGTRLSYEGPDRMTVANVDVPPLSHVKIITDVIYAGAEGEGYIVFRNETLDREILENFIVTSLYPIGYEIRVENVE